MTGFCESPAKAGGITLDFDPTFGENANVILSCEQANVSRVCVTAFSIREA